MPFNQSRCHCATEYYTFYRIWTIRSLLLKMATILLLLAFLLNVTAVFTSHWLTGPLGSLGMFQYVVPKAIATGFEVPVVCPILGVLSVIVLLSANILNIFFVTKSFFLVIPAVIVFSFVAALMQMTIIVAWSVPHVTTGQRLSWSFIVATVSVVTDMAGCGMCVMEFLSRREHSQFISARDMQSFRHISQLEELNSDSDSNSATESADDNQHRTECPQQTSECAARRHSAVSDSLRLSELNSCASASDDDNLSVEITERPELSERGCLTVDLMLSS